ncbi:MAG: hypothetical protein HY329_06750 [Chloroflexi bacterium]|nr:hypothetical protein [Chloroflexota bacterium]
MVDRDEWKLSLRTAVDELRDDLIEVKDEHLQMQADGRVAGWEQWRASGRQYASIPR